MKKANIAPDSNQQSETNLVVLHPHLLYPGGASRYMLEVSSRLVEKGIPVVVILTRLDRKMIESYKKIKFIEVGGPSTGEIFFWLTLPFFILRLKKILAKIPDKILFPQIFPPVWWGAVYKFFSPKTCVVWMCQEPSAFIHSPMVIKSLRQPGRALSLLLNPVLKAIDKFLVKKVNFIIANSCYGASLIEKTYAKKADLIAYPAVNLKHFKPQGRKNNYLFTISRLDKQKNVDFLIKAFSLLQTYLKNEYQLVIGGIGRERKNLEKLARELKVEKQIRFLGLIEDKDLPRWYAQARIVIFCAQNEPFGIIPVEAMACGTPVVGLKSGGVVESVVDGKTGILLKEKSEEKLARTLSYLLKNQSQLEKMSQNARKHVEKNFSWDKTADEIFKFLKKI